jgi:intracellular sulfur oxidation DsrE/DsrF family protein
VLANSKTVSVFDDSTHPNNFAAISDLSASGVAFEFCRNSLNSLNITEDELPDFVTVIPVGVLALITKQADGFAYIKP